MKDRRWTGLRLFALSLIAYMGIHHHSLRQSKGTASGEGGSSVSNGRRAAHNNLVTDANGVISSTGSSGSIQEGRVVISGTQLTYRYPGTFTETTSDSHQNNMGLVVGVLSMASSSGYSRRQAIRNTWAQDYKGRVFFVVAGDWSKIEKEFEELQDLIWVDMEETWLHLTYKVQTFYHAVGNHFALSYDYIMKTDDDSYVFVPAWESLLGKIKIWRKDKKHMVIDYFGKCTRDSPVVRDPQNRYYVPKEVYSPDRYPPYALGDGYAVTKDMNKCMLDYMATIKYMPMEDVATGLLVQKCNSFCINTPIYNKVQHHVKKRGEMLRNHMKEMFSEVEEVEN